MEDLYTAIVEEMKGFTPISSMDLFLYESGLEKSPVFDKNVGILENVTNMIGRLIHECIQLIKNVIGSLRNCVDYVFLSDEKKKRYQKYCAYVKSHPELGKQQVKVSDWKKVDRHYENAIRRADNLSKRVAAKQISKEEAKKEEKDIMDSLSNVVGKCSSIMTVDLALQMAAGSTESAKLIQRTMTTNQALMERMAQDLGAKETRNFQKKVAQMTKDTYFTKLKTMIFQKKQRDISETVNVMLEQIGNLDSFSGKVDFAKTHKKAIGLAGKQLATDKEFRKDFKRVAKAGKEQYQQYEPTINRLKEIKQTILG